MKIIIHMELALSYGLMRSLVFCLRHCISCWAGGGMESNRMMIIRYTIDQ